MCITLLLLLTSSYCNHNMKGATDDNNLKNMMESHKIEDNVQKIHLFETKSGSSTDKQKKKNSNTTTKFGSFNPESDSLSPLPTTIKNAKLKRQPVQQSTRNESLPPPPNPEVSFTRRRKQRRRPRPTTATTADVKQDKKNDNQSQQDEVEINQKRRRRQQKVMTESEKQAVIKKSKQYLRANIKLISACQDEEITMDCSNVLVRFGLRKSKRASMASGLDGGACTSVLLKILYMHHSNPKILGCEDPSYAKLLDEMSQMLKSKGYPQVPALTSSRYLTLQDKFRVIPNNFNGNRKALVIGINYTGEVYELPGCHNDCYNMIKFLKDVHGFVDDDFTILMDDGTHTKPTRDNILKSLHRFAWSVKAGDALFFHYAGHGSTQPDDNGDEESGLDSTMLPVDYQTKGVIVDDEIFRILLIPMPSGVEMTAVMDCCHSGSILDLPFEFIGDGPVGQTEEEAALANVRFPHMDLVKAEQRRMHVMESLQKRASQIEVEFMKPPPTKRKQRRSPPPPSNKQEPKRSNSPRTGRRNNNNNNNIPAPPSPHKQQQPKQRSKSPKDRRNNKTNPSGSSPPPSPTKKRQQPKNGQMSNSKNNNSPSGGGIRNNNNPSTNNNSPKPKLKKKHQQQHQQEMGCCYIS